MALRSTLRADFDHFLQLAGGRSSASLWRMAFNPRTLPVLLIRIAISRRFAVLGPVRALLRLVVMWLFRVEVPKKCHIGPGLVLPHPGGIVLGAGRIGSNVVIFQNVTLGARSFDPAYDMSNRPQIGNGVTIGAGAVVLGPVVVGDDATIAANSLVVTDIAPRKTAIGVPATSERRS
ncbi:MAG: serine acetyltransferase [Marinomonas sp.]